MSVPSTPTRLTSLPADIWAQFLARLKPRNFARLACTGNKIVLQRLVTSPLSVAFYHQRGTVPTQLQRMLIASSSDVLVTDECLSHARQDLINNPSSIRKLQVITIHHVAYDRFVPSHDFASMLTNLQSFEYWHAWISEPLVLSKTLTHLSVQCNTSRPVKKLDSFKSLTSLDIQFMFDHQEEEFLSRAKWPPHLVKLKYELCSPQSAKLLHMLPTTLTDLRLGSDRHYDVNFDLWPLCNQFDKLVNLKIDLDGVRMNRGQLPPSLTRLKIGYMRIVAPSTCVSVFNAFPPSLTEFTFGTLNLKSDNDMSDDDMRDLAMALQIVLPRMTLKSVESAMHYVLRHDYRLELVPELRKVVAANLVKFGLNDEYYQLETSTRTCSSVHTVLFDSKASPRAIDAYCRGHRGRLHTVEVVQPKDSPDASMQELEWLFGLGDYVRQVCMTYIASCTPPFPHVMCDKVRHITVCNAEDDKLPDAFFSRPMPRLKSLILHLRLTKSTDDAVRKLYANRHNFPSLQSFDTTYTSLLSTESRRLLAQMRLYGDLDSSELRYAVQPPSGIARDHPWLIEPLSPINQEVV